MILCQTTTSTVQASNWTYKRFVEKVDYLGNYWRSRCNLGVRMRAEVPHNVLGGEATLECPQHRLSSHLCAEFAPLPYTTDIFIHLHLSIPNTLGAQISGGKSLVHVCYGHQTLINCVAQHIIKGECFPAIPLL